MKVLKSIAALAAAAVLAAAALLAACQTECEHDYGGWKVIQAPTCTEEGTEQGVCRKCGAVTTRSVAPDPESHSYGEWEVTTLPTEAAAGKAVKTCANNPSHTLEAVLPALTDDGAGYLSSAVTKQPTVNSAGERTLVLEHEAGNITVVVPIAATAIQSVADAVLIGSSNAAQVRQVTGKVSGDTERMPISSFSYEFGDNYTHIVDGADYTERWYSVGEDGEVFGVYQYATETPVQDPAFNVEYLKGYSYAIGRAGGPRFYGCEDFLSKMYEWALSGTNGDFAEEIVQEEGETVYRFSFGYLNVPDYFCLISVRFTLTATNAIKNLVMYSVAYDKVAWALDEETGYCSVTDPDGFHYTEYIEFNQTTVHDLPDDYVPPVNPYDKDTFCNTFYVSSFRLTYNSAAITDETVVEINAKTGVTLYITDITPALASFTYDNPLVYWRTDDGDILLDFYATDSNIASYYDAQTNSIYVRSMVAGAVTIVVKPQSGRCEKVVHFNVKRVAPTSLALSVYEYGDAGYLWNASATTATVYVGQTLTFKATVPTQETTYADPTVTAAVTSSNAATGALEQDQLNGETVYRFVATAAGEYTVYCRSNAKSSVSFSFTVKVEQPPAIGGVLYGTHTGNLQYPERGSVSVTFTQSVESSATGTVTVTTSEGVETLSYTYDGQTLTTEHKSGAELGFSLALNEVYKVVATHPTGVGDTTETVVLNQQTQQ